MKKVMLLVLVAMMAGCATTKDIEGLQTQVDVLKVSVEGVSQAAQAAKVVSAQASVSAAFAAKAALDAVQSQQEIAAKLDALFKHTMEK